MKSELIQELNTAIRSLYYVISNVKEKELQDELYSSIYSLERVLTGIENEL